MTEPATPPAGKTLRRGCRRLLLCSLVLLMLPLAGLVFLLGTEAGLQLLIRASNQLAAPYFSAAQAEGRLFDRWRLAKVRIQIKNAADISVDECSVAWDIKALAADRALHLRQIAVHGLTVRIAESGRKENEEKRRQRVVLPQIRLPLGLRIDELRVADSRIAAADGKDALIIHELLAQASARDDQAEITRLKADTSQFGGDMRGRVRFTGAWPVQISGSWRVPDHGINELHGTVEAQGNFDKVIVAATMTSPAKVTLQGEATDILNELHWRAAAETGQFQLHDIRVNVPVEGALRVVEASGTVKGYRGVLAADIHHKGYPRVQAEAKVEAADYTGLKIDFLTVRHEAAELTLRGAMRWKGGFSWQAELEAKEIDPSLAAPRLPGRISGLIRSSGLLERGLQTLEVSLDGIQGTLTGIPFRLNGALGIADKAIHIDQLRLQSGSASVQVSGTAAADKDINLAVQAQADDLSAWVPEAGGALQVKGTATGSAAQPAVKLNAAVSKPRFRGHALSVLEAKLDAVLDNSGSLTVRDLHAVADGKAAVRLKGTVGWQNGLTWQAALKTAGLDPGLFAPAWPGAITAELRSQGCRTAGTLAAELRIDQLHGTLRGFPVQGGGAVLLDGRAVTAEALRLQSGSTFVQASGKADVDKGVALSFKAGSDDLASLAPSAAGRFQAEGALSGSLRQPNLALKASGSKLKMQEYSLKELKAAVQADLAPAGQVDAEITAGGLQIRQETLRTAQLRLKGGAEQHRLDLSAEGSPGSLRLVAAGGWQGQRWQGQLAELALRHRQFGAWKTEQAADLTLSAQRCSLSDLTLTQDAVRAALSGSWEKTAGWQAQAQVDGLALNRLRRWQIPVPKDFPEMQGVLAVTAAAQGQGAAPQEARLSVSLPELALTATDYDAEDGTTTWRWTGNQVTARLEQGTLRLNAQTSFQDGSTAALDAAASNCGDFSKPEQMPLSGRLAVRIMDIAPLTQLTGYAVQTQGGFGGAVALSGTVARPLLEGTLALNKGAKAEGRIHVPAAGINLSELRLAAAGDGSRNQLEVTAVSGPGRLRASGEISRTPGQPLAADFAIQGENVQAVDLPEYQVVISPDLRLRRNGSGTALSGRLVVPKARIAPAGFSGPAASSQDVAVVDSDDKPPEHSLPFSASVALELGKEVAVDAFGVKGFLDGGLTVSAKPDQIVTATGTLSLRDTSVAFEGVSLALSEGRIFYQGGPIDNPGVDIIASKKASNVEAGIHLFGNPDDLEIKLFSDTPMQDSEILSWLLSGESGRSLSRKGEAVLSPAAAALSKMGGGALLKSVNPLAAVDMEDFVDVSIGGGKEASDVSLVMGKEVYKDLYLSYGKDLTGEGGSFRARYDLKYGFSVESETTAKTTGADLIWSLER